METFANLPIVFCESAQHWDDWLAAHHAQSKGIWLKIAKKGTGRDSVSYAEALDAALCYGWIDAQKQSYDDTYWLQKFTPRRPKSVWSKVNTEHAERLIAAGRMATAGQREIDAARQDGRWAAAYAPQSARTIPDDFRAALEQHPQAQAFFATLNTRNRYAICYRIESARKPETRRARIEKFIAMLDAHEQIYPS